MNDIDLGLSIVAEIEQDVTKINLSEKGKNLPTKLVPTKKFIKTLSSVLEKDEHEESPLLPSNYGTKKMMNAGVDYYFIITTPPGEKELSYSGINFEYLIMLEDDEYEERIGYDTNAYYEVEEYLNKFNIYDNDDFSIRPYLPSLVWFIHIRKNNDNDSYRLIKDRLYAKDSVILSMNDNIYPAPLSNMYYENNICWGDPELPLLTIPGVMALERIFFNLRFNMDLESVSTKPFRLNDTLYKAKFLHLVENQKILNEEGEESAAAHMNNLIRGSRPHYDKTIQEVWDEFTN